jgi:hypothetical protein
VVGAVVDAVVAAVAAADGPGGHTTATRVPLEAGFPLMVALVAHPGTRTCRVDGVWVEWV